MLVALLGATSWPLVAAAQPADRPIVGFLSGRSAGESSELVKAFHRGLAESGHVDGRTVTIEYRWAEGRYDRLPALAGELVARKAAVIAAVGGGVAGLAAKAATATIPIVFASGGDAVKLGLVASLNRPGGNVTGVNIIFGALGAKRLEFLRELVTSARSVALLANPDYPSTQIEVDDVRAAARSLGLRLEVFLARTEAEIATAFAALVAQQVNGLLVADDPYLQSQRDMIVRLAAAHALPTIYFSRDFADAGGLISYGPSIVEVYRHVGLYTGRVLKGDKPADLPVVQPTKIELVINLATARALGLDVPGTLRVAAEELIE